MSNGPEGGQGAQPGQPDSWPPPETQEWQPGSSPAPPAPGWPSSGPGGSGGPSGPGYPGGPPAGPGGPGMPGGYPGGPTGPAYPGGPGGPGPGGPGGPPPWGGPAQPYGFGPPPAPAKKGGAGVFLAIGAGVLALIVIVVVVVAVSKGSGDDPKKTSGKAAAEAGRALGSAGGAIYTGTYGGNQATFKVTKAGSARGTYNSHGSPVSRVDVGGATYIKADSSYWSAEGQSSTESDKAANKWAKSPDSATDLKLADFSPAKLSQVLQQAGNDPQAVNTPAGSTPAIKMTVGESTYYISKKSPHRLLRIEGTAGSDSYALDVQALQGSEMSTVFSELRGDVQDLKDVYDPSITTLPMGKIQFGSCTESGCTVHGSVMPSSTGTSTASVHITMNAKFWGDGPTVSTCKGTGTTTPSHETTITCRTSGSAWTSWYRSHNGRFTIHASSTFDATVNSSSDVNELLTKLQQEQQGG
ncbi:hypothetical protein [Actinoallomurus iriomotensis]|uniref:Uncharacterized protein n=1 Tax=Actinoallomurus iriomotensis TaxID=478107 RepID=A0A9W6VTR1_9ACTN|nr:hypothetical protein [Actinoallomurus iriomotensis]GLY78772.1 hypothetical protein Airi01_070390 [Actinoallomurus iriomotensis]